MPEFQFLPSDRQFCEYLHSFWYVQEEKRQTGGKKFIYPSD